MRLVLLVTLFLSVALSQSRVVNGQIVDKDGRISRYEENNANRGQTDRWEKAK